MFKGITHISINSFYTCRYLHILIYIPDSSPTIDPARSIPIPNILLLFYLPPHPNLLFPPHPNNLIYLQFSSSPTPHFILYLSVLTSTYLYSINIQSQYSKYLTPHVLSEWMVEVCWFEVCVLVYVYVLSWWMVV